LRQAVAQKQKSCAGAVLSAARPTWRQAFVNGASRSTAKTRPPLGRGRDPPPICSRNFDLSAAAFPQASVARRQLGKGAGRRGDANDRDRGENDVDLRYHNAL
jgi:hypothetical protein